MSLGPGLCFFFVCQVLYEFFLLFFCFFFNDTATTEIYTRSIVGSVRCVQETGYQRRVHGLSQKFAESLKVPIRIVGVPSPYFNWILEYIYGDSISIPNVFTDFKKLLLLMKYGDYFLLPGVVRLCSCSLREAVNEKTVCMLSLIHISEPTRPLYISYAVFCLKKKKKQKTYQKSRCISTNINRVTINQLVCQVRI
eukprot:TRINITY_DN7039_c0_g1_i1.p1 TRINITY_DN7039_c0_g1~~TRINITY_DN7039_c0_g1_i1.p1  ORF type:complete len:196 (+),score=34.63 TRINITY_DN7039_c0_g1_i1:37-624(+)